MKINNKNNQPMVSVCMISYNHEKFINQALDSVLMQKVNFDYEIVVGEDCSTDNTRNYLLDYSGKYPDLFKLVLQKQNVGSIQNFIDSLNACTGKYIAYLETDDYWTDDYKLQKQIDFLENNPDYGMVHTRASVVNQHNDFMFNTENNSPSGEVFEDLIFKSSFIVNCTICYRKQIIEKLLKTINEKKLNYILDYYIWVYIALFSKIVFLSDITAAHRSHSGGITKQGSDLYTKTVPYILTDIIKERFAYSGVRKLKLYARYKYGMLYSGALLSKGMMNKDKIRRSSFYLKQFYLLPTLLSSFFLKLYIHTKRHIQFKNIF